MKCVTNGEFRNVVSKTSAKGNRYYIYRFEDLETGKPFEIIGAEQFPVNKGESVEIHFSLEIGKYTNMSIIDIKPLKR